MEDVYKLIVGLDLGEETTQLSVFNHKTYDAEAIYENKQEPSTIPTALTVTADTKDWLFGREALEYLEHKEGILLHSFLTHNQVREVYGTHFTRESLLEKYLRKVLLLLKREYPHGIIEKMVVTIKQMDPELITDLMQALKNLGILEDRVKVISHQLSYLHFALYQKKELWMNDVSMFDFDETGLTYYQISMDRRNRPMVAKVISKPYIDKITYDMVKNNEETLPYMFSSIVNTVMHKQIISTVYLTGVGFMDNWFEPCLQDLCVGRRVFVGENLYSYGACYAAREMTSDAKLGDFALLCDNTVGFSVSMNAYWEANLREVILVELGTPWYEVNQQFEVILDDEKEVPFTIRDIMSKEVRKHIIALEDMPRRSNKTTRLQIRILCSSPHSLVITVKDMGFGAFYPTTNRIWEKTLSI